MIREAVSSSSAANEARPSLRRSISLPWLVLYGLGTTIGAGIYALMGVVAGQAGMHAPVAFLLACGLALFTAFSFAELSARFPRAGGEAVYVLEGFGWKWLFTTVGLLAAASGTVSAATVSVGLVGYLGEFVSLPPGPVIAGVVLSLAAIAIWGVRQSVFVAGAMTLIEVGGLLAIVAYGADHLQALPSRGAELIPREFASWHGVGLAAVICFYAFLGFEDMVNVAEEVKGVRRTLPVAILTTLLVTALLYGLVSTVSVLAVSPAELAESEAPLALVFSRSGGSVVLLSGIAMIALVNGALVQIIKSSRILYGLAREGALPERLGRVGRRTRTPVLATVLVAAVIAALALQFPIRTLAEVTSSITLLTFALANLSLTLVKRRDPAPAGIICVPGWIPVAGAVVSFGFLALELARYVC